MTSPYYQNGYQRRYAWQWWAGQAGTTPPTRAPHSSLGMADMLESGFGDRTFAPYPALSKYARCAGNVTRPCALRAKAAAQLAGLGDTIYDLEATPYTGEMGDWPLVRPQGPEPGPFAMGLPVWSGLSNNEKIVAVAGLAALGWWFWRRRRRGRRNPWAVRSRTRGVTGSLIFTSKERAKEYASYLRKANKPASVKPVRRRRRKRR